MERSRPAVLIVESGEPMRRALRDLISLRLPGRDVLDAADGATALRLAAERQPRLVLIDICLPDANGITLTERLMALAPGTFIVVISIQASNYIVERALAAGAAAFIEKDRLSAELLPLIARLDEEASEVIAEPSAQQGSI